MIDAVIFDLDGVLVDSEQLWDQARRAVVREREGVWPAGATEAMQGMSTPEWSEYVHAIQGVDLPASQIAAQVVDKVAASYQEALPLNPGAVAAVRRIAERWPLGVASSSDRNVIDEVIELAGLQGVFSAIVSSEEVTSGKPAPDVYLEAARRLGIQSQRAAAVEDSANGIRSALSAGMCVLALPNPHYPPPAAVIEEVHLVLTSLDDLTVETVMQADAKRTGRIEHRLDEQEIESFPASDPHADWAGPV